jgi:hypothetical protein
MLWNSGEMVNRSATLNAPAYRPAAMITDTLSTIRGVRKTDELS